MQTKPALRRLLSSTLPDALLQSVRKLYYAHLLNSLTEGLEIDLTLLQLFVRPRDIVVDVGANIGVYTKFLSRCVGAGGRVYSIEPIPSTYDILGSNIKKLRLTNAIPINCAISDRDDFVTMEVPRWDSGGDNFYLARVSAEPTDSSLKRFRVEAKTIDSLLGGIPNISFIKCDTEGHELQCVRGALNTIRRSQPVWLMEILGELGDKDSSAFETFKVLSECGYGAYWFDGTNLIERRSGDKSVNYWFLAPEHIRKLNQEGCTILASKLRSTNCAIGG